MSGAYLNLRQLETGTVVISGGRCITGSRGRRHAVRHGGAVVFVILGTSCHLPFNKCDEKFKENRVNETGVFELVNIV